MVALLAGCGPSSHRPTQPGAPAARAGGAGGGGPAGDGQGVEGGEEGAVGPELVNAAPAATPASAGAATSEAEAIVVAHNRIRATHCAPPLTWSPKVAAVAQKWAETLRDRSCAFEHSHGSYGENLAAGSSGSIDPAGVVAMWTDEEKAYDSAHPGFSMEAGHFTQVVWKGTTQVGCGHVRCGGMDVWVCNYDPPGNYEGEFPANVHMAGCK
jgi:hypothetical protein